MGESLKFGGLLGLVQNVLGSGELKHLRIMHFFEVARGVLFLRFDFVR